MSQLVGIALNLIEKNCVVNQLAGQWNQSIRARLGIISRYGGRGVLSFAGRSLWDKSHEYTERDI